LENRVLPKEEIQKILDKMVGKDETR
jgi:hypothetical protein